MEIRKFVRKRLFELCDLKYKKFHSSLCPGVNNIIGVRVPIVKSYAKELLKSYSFYELYDAIDTYYYEEILLKGVILGFSKEDSSVKIEYIKKYVPLIDNWGICDCFCGCLKFTKQNMDDVRSLIYTYVDSDKEFEIRFAIVMIIDYYITSDYLEDNFRIFDSINNNCYYVEMAIAWAISICLIKFYDETVSYLKNCNLSNFVYNKAIQKACESFRISSDRKNELRNMKR